MFKLGVDYGGFALCLCCDLNQYTNCFPNLQDLQLIHIGEHAHCKLLTDDEIIIKSLICQKLYMTGKL